MTKEGARFTLRIKPNLKERLEKSSRNMGISLNALVVQILWNWVEHRDELFTEEPGEENKTPAR